MVLQCLQQMIQLRAHNMRSGWRTMFAVFSAASKVLTGKRIVTSFSSRLSFLAQERIVTTAFDIVTRLNIERFADIVANGSFADFTVCITDFCKANKFQKISLLAINMLQGVIPTMLRTPECGLLPASPTPDHANGLQAVDDPMIKSWYPILFSFYDVIMNGEDLEVRRLCVTAFPLWMSSNSPCASCQCLGYSLQYAQEVRLYFRSRFLGHSQPRAAIPDFRCPSVVTRFVKVSNPGRHERMALDDYDPSPSEPHRSIHILF